MVDAREAGEAGEVGDIEEDVGGGRVVSLAVWKAHRTAGVARGAHHLADSLTPDFSGLPDGASLISQGDEPPPIGSLAWVAECCERQLYLLAHEGTLAHPHPMVGCWLSLKHWERFGQRPPLAAGGWLDWDAELCWLIELCDQLWDQLLAQQGQHGGPGRPSGPAGPAGPAGSGGGDGSRGWQIQLEGLELHGAAPSPSEGMSPSQMPSPLPDHPTFVSLVDRVDRW
jgi:hypothetical protein